MTWQKWTYSQLNLTIVLRSPVAGGDTQVVPQMTMVPGPPNLSVAPVRERPVCSLPPVLLHHPQHQNGGERLKSKRKKEASSNRTDQVFHMNSSSLHSSRRQHKHSDLQHLREQAGRRGVGVAESLGLAVHRFSMGKDSHVMCINQYYISVVRCQVVLVPYVHQ